MTDYTDMLQDQDDDDQGMTAVRKALRAADKRAKEAEERAEKAEAKSRVDDVKGLLHKAGIKEAVARYVPKDVTDADSLDVWLKSDEGSVFADSRIATADQENAEVVDPALAVFSRLSNVEQGGDQRQSLNGDKVSQTLNGLAQQNLSDKDIFAALAALDAGKLPTS